jgi:23S rRNA pseudouridine2604 synthase
MENSEYPMRINKYLAKNNICSRREADEMIRQGKIQINGRIASLGEKVLETDEIKVFKDEKRKRGLAYFAFNKPRGIITHSPQEGEKSIADILHIPFEVFPMGRLDKDSSGLIILTNDGRVTDKLLNPEHYHEKEYQVRVDKEINSGFIRRMSGGVDLDEYKTRKCEVEEINENTFSIILTEGKKHQIRRMCEKLGYAVVHLERKRILNIKLGNLKPGEHRKIKGGELKTFLQKLGLEK